MGRADVPGDGAASRNSDTDAHGEFFRVLRLKLGQIFLDVHRGEHRAARVIVLIQREIPYGENGVSRLLCNGTRVVVNNPFDSRNVLVEQLDQRFG